RGALRSTARVGRAHRSYARAHRGVGPQRGPLRCTTIEKKLVASLKRLEGETLIRQIARARAAVYPQGQPQERELTLSSFSIRYGPALVDALEQEVARWAGAS